MMAAGVLLMLLLAESLSCIDGQGYTEVHDWPGPEIIPNDGRMFISDGNVKVQLPTNSTVREVKIREQVNITLDCGPHIDAVLGSLSGIPPGFIPKTTWYRNIKGVNGILRSIRETVQDNKEIAIYGDKMRFLQIHKPLISVPAKQGNAGLYTCEFCYEFDLPLGGGRSVSCAESNTLINIRGDPPVINRGFTPPDGNILISTTICRPVIEVTLVCPQMGRTRPVGTASYLINGMPIDLDSSLTFLRESRVTAAIDDRVSIFVSDYPPKFEGVFTCNLTNPFGFDTESSLILQTPTVPIFVGTIQGTASTNCPGTPANTICPIIGQTVNLNCASNAPFNSINITDPNGVLIATNSTSFMVDSGTPFGTYSCTVFNECGMQTRTVTVQQSVGTCRRPVVTVAGSALGVTGYGCTPSTIGKNICANVSSTVTLSCSSTDDYTIIGPNPLRLSHNKSLTFTVNGNDYGAYICISTNPCGVSTSYIQLDKPSISIPPSGVSITPIYETITLACSADGATHYQWTDLTTGEIISNNSIHYITAGCGKNKKKGQYQCVASNEAGKAASAIFNGITC